MPKVPTLLILACALVFEQGTSRPDELVARKPTCVNNLRMIAMGLLSWSYAHGGKYPFNVSTNLGGTMEFCGRRADGLDTNSFAHFRVLTDKEELPTPLLLVCPKDTSKHPAQSIQDLQRENVTYLLHSGTNVDRSHPNEVLAVCPVDGNTLYCSGEVVEGKRK